MNAHDIKEFRYLFGFTQKTLAAMLGVRPGTVEQWEQEKRCINPVSEGLLNEYRASHNRGRA